MKILLPASNTNHRLLDSGDGSKLEQFGINTIIRPESICLWQKQHPDLWDNAIASLGKDKKGLPQWRAKAHLKEPWIFSYKLPGDLDAKLVCSLHLSPSKNIGIFPEQAAHWDWMVTSIQAVKSTPSVLNLFGYTGAATLCAAAAGAQVCHVDASQSAITWARENQKLSKLTEAPIRWIVDDCSKFLEREIKREVLYDGIILDPPAFGRDPKGRMFKFEQDIAKLLGLVQKVLKPKPLFFIFNSYATGLPATVLANLVADMFPKQALEYGELHLPIHGSKTTLPCNIFVRFSNH